MKRVQINASDPEAGYTLIELLVTLSIMAVLIAIITPQVVGYLGRAKSGSAKVQIENISAALDLYYLDMGSYPTTDDGLQVLWTPPVEQDGTWQGPYLRVKDNLKDPWGEPYYYAQPGQFGTYDLYTLGADKAEGGEGDAVDVANFSK